MTSTSICSEVNNILLILTYAHFSRDFYAKFEKFILLSVEVNPVFSKMHDSEGYLELQRSFPTKNYFFIVPLQINIVFRQNLLFFLFFFSYKMSGIGREGGEYGLENYTEVKTVITAIPEKNS